VEHASFTCKDNGESGIYDFIFNLNMLDSFVQEGDTPLHLIKQLSDIKGSGYSYILFNQGC
jgi:hypothetical protein